MQIDSWQSSDPVPSGFTANGVTALCDENLARAKAITNDIRTLKDAPDEALTWEATFGALDDAILALELASTVPSLMHMTHPDAAVREAASKAEPKVSEFVTELFLDAELANVFKRFANTHPELEGARKKFVDETLRDYRRNGLDLPHEGQKRLRELNEELTKLGQEFESNIASSLSHIDVKPEQLDGLPESFIAAHPSGENGLVRITTAYPDYKPFMKYAKDRDAAKRLYVAYNTRAQNKNLPILNRVLALRKEKATLLGYETWAHYVLETRMAKEPSRVFGFLEGLHAALKPRAAEEFAAYGHAAIPISDASYYEEFVNRRDYAFDSAALSEYFESSTVFHGMLDVMSELFGIEFRSIDLPAWQEEVRCLEVTDGGEPLGRIYLDLHPRDNKYSHAAVFGIRNARKLPDGSRLLPMCSLVCNFPRKGALLSHEDVVTLFHEFGHALHKIMYQGELSSLGGLNVARDFVEAPSQMLEEWAWQRASLDRFARHHKTGAPIPDELFDAMTKSRHVGEAIATERQLFLAMLDLTYHTREPGFDTTKVLKELHVEYSQFRFIEGTHFQACFGHLMGYDAGYYGYQWALAIARDLLTRFEKEGLTKERPRTKQKWSRRSSGARRMMKRTNVISARPSDASSA
ncbi:oligopeptidase A [Candidatus Uhrbacteria bacterium]|nr:MAG: oligopeptidase A [Candidatus Uhrbacteria bacterium]